MDVTTLPIELDGDRFDSRFRLVHVASQRARQLMEGAKATVQTKYAKECTIALEDVCVNTFAYQTGKEARQAKKTAQQLKEEARKSLTFLSRHEEIAEEIRKDLSVYVEESKKEEREEEEG